MKLSSRKFILAVGLTALGFTAPLQAADLYWTGTVPAATPATAAGGSWNISDTSWSTTPLGTANSAWNNNLSYSNAFFSGTGGTVTVDDTINVNNLTFTGTSGNFVIEDFGGVSAYGVISNTSVVSQNIATFAGGLELHGNSTISVGNGLTMSNGGYLDISRTTAPTVTLTSLNNSYLGFHGNVILGKKTLNLASGLTLNGTDEPLNHDALSFELDSPGASGLITVSGGTFTGSDDHSIAITLSDTDFNVTAGTYTLIDWTNASLVSGVDLSDFYIESNLLPTLVDVTLKLSEDGKKLQLVAVPEPATVAMPLAALFGMLYLRRRAPRQALEA